jgi:Chitobiase/beta-hexosaminidase C-terminal domain
VATPLAGERLTGSVARVGLNSARTYVYYTTDRTAPTAKSTLYTGPITVTKIEVIEAIGVASGYANSAVTIQDYRVQ